MNDELGNGSSVGKRVWHKDFSSVSKTLPSPGGEYRFSGSAGFQPAGSASILARSETVVRRDATRTSRQDGCATLLWLWLWFVCALPSAHAETILLHHAIVHTVSGGIITNGGVLIDGAKIARVFEGRPREKISTHQTIDLRGQHLYPGLIAVDSVLGLTEISAVRSTQDTTEVGEYTPEVESWIAVNPDSELLPVARANGIAYFQPVPKGGIVSGQSALLSLDGWTYEQMAVKKPVALHVFWPGLELNTAPKELSADPSKWKSLDDQAKDRHAKLRGLIDFFDEARAYAKAKAAAQTGSLPEKTPAWEALLPYVQGELPVIIHADELRQIKSAVNWAVTNRIKIILAGGRDAWRTAELLATNQIPVIYEHVFTRPTRDTEAYDALFVAPERLRQAGVKVTFGTGPDSFGAGMTRNLPYAAAQACAFGFPRDEALKGLTLYPAQWLGLADRLGAIEAGKDATLFVAEGDIFDLRTHVKRMWIAGREVSLESRHTRLYEKYRNRPKPN